MDRSHLTAAKRRLPDRPLLAAPPGRSLVLVLAHDASCAACAAYVQTLRNDENEFTAWDAQLVVLNGDAARQSAHGFGELPVVVVADQWRDIREVYAAGDAHRFPDVAALEEWVRFLATQCPECEGESL